MELVCVDITDRESDFLIITLHDDRLIAWGNVGEIIVNKTEASRFEEKT